MNRAVAFWNYKTATLSAVVRAVLFFSTNVAAGLEAAMAAMTTEFCLRFLASGFYGSLTQAFRHIEPPAVGTAAALVVLPLLGHSLEFVVHRWSGTERLAASMVASVTFTILSTAFNLFVMRRGVLVVGPGRRTLWEDMRAMPSLVLLFVTSAARTCVRLSL